MPDTTPPPDTAPVPSGDPRERIGLSIPWTEPRAILDLVERAEQAGVTQFWTTQNPTSTDALTAFAAVFPRTRAIRLGTSIVPVYPRHPLALAQQAATAAAFGPGRLRLGVGTSHGPSTEGVYGLKMDQPLAYLREYIAVLRAALWDGAVDHAGRFFTARVTLPNPPRVPILMAALGESAFRLAGEVSDGAISWNVPPRHLLDVSLPALRDGARSAGRPAPPLVAHVPVVLSADRDAARAAARKALSGYARLPFYTQMWAAAGYPTPSPGVVSDALIDALVVMGDEAAVAARLQELLAAGLDELLVNGLSLGDPAAERERLIRFAGGLGPARG
jgi:F420-dependent oxidoreductase-like protein